MNKGVEFTYNDGSKDWYDPVDVDEGFAAAGGDYLITVGGTTYAIERNIVKSLRYYDLCPECGRELRDGKCNRCG